MLENVFGIQALFWISYQHLRNQIFTLARYILKLFVVEAERAEGDLSEEFFLGALEEGQVPTHGVVEQHTQRPHVYLGGVTLA